MTPEEHTTAINALQSDVSEIKAVLNNGLRSMVHDQRSELATVKSDIQLIRDALTGHVAKEDVVYEVFKRVMNTGVAITGALRSRCCFRSLVICWSIRSISPD
jgi:hypothetical protein